MSDFIGSNPALEDLQKGVDELQRMIDEMNVASSTSSPAATVPPPSAAPPPTDPGTAIVRVDQVQAIFPMLSPAVCEKRLVNKGYTLKDLREVREIANIRASSTDERNIDKGKDAPKSKSARLAGQVVAIAKWREIGIPLSVQKAIAAAQFEIDGIGVEFLWDFYQRCCDSGEDLIDFVQAIAETYDSIRSLLRRQKFFTAMTLTVERVYNRNVPVFVYDYTHEREAFNRRVTITGNSDAHVRAAWEALGWRDRRSEG